MARNMPITLSVYLTPEFRPVWEVLDSIATRERIGMSTLIKRATTEWAHEHGLDPSYVLEQDKELSIRTSVGSKPPCRFRMMLKPNLILCKAEHKNGEQKDLSSCVDCELYKKDPLR